MVPYAQGVGFAIPINTVKRIATEILEHGRVSRRWIGISGIDMSMQLGRRYRIPTDAGFLVAEVVAGSPAHEADLRPGDVIVWAGGQQVRHTKDLLFALSKVEIGGIINLEVLRLGSKMRVSVRPNEAPLVERFSGQ